MQKHPSQKKISTHTSSLLIALVVMCTGLYSQASTIVYRQTFGTDVSDPSWLQDATWDTDWSPRNGSNGSTPTVRLNSYNGTPTDLAPINAESPAPAVLDQGFVNYLISSGVDQGWTFTTDMHTLSSIAREDIDKGISITWYQLGETANLQTHLLVEIDNGWYVSDDTFTSTNTGGVSTFSSRANQVGTLLSDTTWKTFKFPDMWATDKAAAIGGSSALPSTGDMSSFGVYMPQTSGFRLMYDTFEVTVIPEPSTLLLLIMGLGCSALALRRRCRA